jgi:Domain of unknown function (DUF4403)
VSLRSRLLFGFSLAAALMFFLTSCRQDEVLAFTKAPARTAFRIEPKPVMTGLFMTLPVDPQEALSAAEAAFPERLARINDIVANAACGRRVKDLECVSGRVEGDIVRNGPIELTAKDGKLLLQVPLKYTASMRGHGWAAGIADTKTAAVTASTSIDALLQTNHALELAAPEAWQWSERQITFGKGQLDLGRAVSAKLQALQSAFAQKISAELAAQPVSAAIHKAWRTLQNPILLVKSPELWLAAEVARISGIGFLQEDRRLSYRIAIGARVSLHDAKPAATAQRAGPAKRPPEPVRPTQDMLTTQLRLPILIGNERLQAIAARAFPAKEQLTTQADRFSDAVQVATHKAQLYASQRQLALELDLDVLGPKPWAGRKGRFHLLGRPVLDAGLDTIAIDSVSMPLTTTRDSRDPKDAGAASKLRIGAEPFAGRFAANIKFDISQDVLNAVAQANAGLEQQIDEHTTLSAKFTAGQASAVEPIGEGLAVIVTVTGQIQLNIDLPQVAGAASAGEQIPSQHAAGVRPKGQPEKGKPARPR